MANKPSIALLFGILIFAFFCVESSEAFPKLAPALYAFGDSNIDPGNNNRINDSAKSNYPPYGVDFPGGATGRATNGYNFADFFATWLGLKIPPAFRLVDPRDYNVIEDGINFASSAAGILPETATDIYKGILSLEAQVELFRRSVKSYLPPHFPSKKALSEHLSKSIFLVVMGANDYSFTFLKQINTTNPLDYDSSANVLLDKLANRLEDLYNLGARKFVVFDIPAVGCIPDNVMKFKPKESKCVNYINSIVSLYNQKLPFKLGHLQSKLSGSNFIVAKFFDFSLTLVQNPKAFGLKDSVNPCCGILKSGQCDPKMPVCNDRNSYVFFDAFHITQASYRLLAKNCFNGAGSCFPMTVAKLALI